MIYEPTGREDLDHYELALIRSDGTMDVFGFGYQPKTDDIADRVQGQKFGPPYTMAVQKIGTLFEVYDLKTLRKMPHMGTWTIGIPVASHENLDAAIMSAVLLS